MAARDPLVPLPVILLPVTAKHTQRKLCFLGSVYFQGGEKKITFKLQLKGVFRVVLMYRINKLCSDVGVYLLQYYAW